jgi:4-aminobutyrate aminotransferase-like enzyme
LGTDGPRVTTEIPGPKSKDLLKIDHRYLSGGSAYGDMFGSGLHAPVFVASEGSYLIDADGNRFMDTTGAFSIGVQGYSPGPLIDAVCVQMRQLMHLANMPNVPMLRLAESLLAISPGDLKEGLVQFEVGGGPTMDLAYKLAHYYAVYGKGVAHPVTLAFMGSYHGRSVGANTLTGYANIRDGMPRTPDVVHIPFAYCYRCPYEKEYPSCGIFCARYVGRLLESSNFTFRDPKTEHNAVATMVIEPIQSHSGMIVPPDEFLPTLADICRQYGITTVVDEICMGIGHTGRWFASDHWGFVPDIMAIAKALTGGSWPLGAVLAKKPIYEVWGAAPDRHMGTYHGSPVGCAAGLATLELIQRDNLLDNARRMGEYFLAGLRDLAGRHPLIGEVCGKGLALGVEFVRDRVTKIPATREARLIVVEAARKGVLILRNGYFDNRITFMPPLNVTREEIGIILEVLDHSIGGVQSSRAA